MGRRNRNRGGGNKTPIKKDLNLSLTRPASREIGQPGVMLTRSFFDDLGERELSPQCIHDTIDEMVRHSAVKHALDATQSRLNKAMGLGVFEEAPTRRGKIIAEFANYCIHNMDKMTWFEAVRNFNSDVERGFSLSEVVTKTAESGPFKGSVVLSRLGPRSQRSVYAWVWDEYQREVTHVVQKPLIESNYLNKPSPGVSYIGNITGTSTITSRNLTANYPIIAAPKLLHFKYDSVNSNPSGRTPLIACYTPWRESVIIGKYQVIGITRDFGGVPIARVPAELMRRANDPEGRYPLDKAEYEVYQQQLANMHAGKQSYFMLSSDLVEGSSSTYEYDLKLLGIDGSGKQFDVSEIIKTKTTEIYNAFGAGHLILGQGGDTSSYNLATSGTAEHNLLIEQSLIEKAEVLETHLIPMLLQANGIDYDYRDLPKFRYKDPQEWSLDEVGKFIQRVGSVNKLDKEQNIFLHKKVGLPIEGLENLDYQNKGTSRAGESQGSSGTGNGSQQNSSTNMENKQLHLVATGDEDVFINSATGDPVFIHKD